MATTTTVCMILNSNEIMLTQKLRSNHHHPSTVQFE